MSLSDSCFCAADRNGSEKFCTCLTLVETEHGPRFSEDASSPSDTSNTSSGAPAGSYTKADAVDTATTAKRLAPDIDSGTAGPPAGSLVK